jgi:hypothetical protein
VSYKKLLIGLSLLLTITGCYSKVPSAGVLPYAYNEQGILCFLIGQEPNGLWADFGGKADPHEKYTQQVAVREGSEETRYVYGRYALLKHNRNKEVYIRSSAALKESKKYLARHLREKLVHPKGYYVMYLADVDYIPAQEFNCAPKVPHYEKKAYVWVPATELLESLKNSADRNNAYVNGMKMRPPFYDTVMHNYGTIMRVVTNASKRHVAKHRIMRAAHTH